MRNPQLSFPIIWVEKTCMFVEQGDNRQFCDSKALSSDFRSMGCGSLLRGGYICPKEDETSLVVMAIKVLV